MEACLLTRPGCCVMQGHNATNWTFCLEFIFIILVHETHYSVNTVHIYVIQLFLYHKNEGILNYFLGYFKSDKIRKISFVNF